MGLRNETPDWEINGKEPFVPITYKGELVGFLHPRYAVRIIKLLNDDIHIKKALFNACRDILGDEFSTQEVRDLMKHYLLSAERPKYGVGAIAILLQERQKELDLSASEFIKFCDSYKLDEGHLREILDSQRVDDRWIPALSRILGKSTDELINIRDGSN